MDFERGNKYIAAMTMWLPNLETRKGPVYRAIADAIDEDVQSGALRAGSKLPPHRDLADHLGVTVTTITRAYTEAARRGLINGHVGRGTFIRGQEPYEDTAADSSVIDLSINFLMPDKEVANLGAHIFQRRALPWTQLFGYAPRRGYLRHRQAMAAWLKQLGMSADPEHIVLTAGAQHGLTSALGAVLAPGETLLMEELTYSGARMIAQQMQLKTRGIAMDAEGLRPDALETACRSTRARALYCMPRMQNPTSAVMSERRRRQVAAIAEKYRLIVVEDDTYGFLSPERTPLAPLIPHRTLFVTSLSKSLFPGLRLGSVVAPPASDRRDRREVPPDRRRGRYLRIPLTRAHTAGTADPAPHALRHELVEEPVPRPATGQRRGAACVSRQDRRRGVDDDDQHVADWGRSAERVD